jgi:hypothetical protein
LRYRVTGNNTVTFIGSSDKKIKKISIPDEVKIKGKKYKVTEIEKKSCYEYSNLTKVEIGDNVKTVGNQSFGKCKKLTNIVFGKGVTTIGSKVLYQNKKLKLIKIESKKLKSIGKDTFKGVTKKVNIKVPSSKCAKYQELINKT